MRNLESSVENEYEYVVREEVPINISLLLLFPYRYCSIKCNWTIIIDLLLWSVYDKSISIVQSQRKIKYKAEIKAFIV